MSRKRRSRKVKTIHVEYTKVFYELLHYEEVEDIDIATIFGAYLKTIAASRGKYDLTVPPKGPEINDLVNLTLDRLGV